MPPPAMKYSWLRELPSSALLSRRIEEMVKEGAVSQGTATNYILHWSTFLMWLAGETGISINALDGKPNWNAPRPDDPTAALDAAVHSCTAAQANRYLAALAAEKKIPTIRTMAASIRSSFRLLKPVLELSIEPDEIKSPTTLENPALTVPVFENWSKSYKVGNSLAQRRVNVRKFLTHVKDTLAIEIHAEVEQAAFDSAMAEAAAGRRLNAEWLYATNTLTGALLLNAKTLFDAYASTLLGHPDLKGMLSSIRSFYRWAVGLQLIQLDIDFALVNPANEKMIRGRRRASATREETSRAIEPARRPPATPPTSVPAAPLSVPQCPISADPPPPTKPSTVIRRVSLGDGRIKNVILPRNAVVNTLISRGDPRLTFGDLVALRRRDVRVPEARLFIRRLGEELLLDDTTAEILAAYDTAIRSTKLFELRETLGQEAPYLMSADGGMLSTDDVEESSDLPPDFFELRDYLLTAFIRRLRVPFWTLVWLPFTAAPTSMPVLNLRSGPVSVPEDLYGNQLRRFRQVVRMSSLKNFWDRSMPNTPLLLAPDGGTITADVIR